MVRGTYLSLVSAAYGFVSGIHFHKILFRKVTVAMGYNYRRELSDKAPPHGSSSRVVPVLKIESKDVGSKSLMFENDWV